MTKAEAIRLHEEAAVFYRRGASKVTGVMQQELLEAADQEVAHADAVRNGTYPGVLDD